MKHIFLVLVMNLLVGSASVAAADFAWVLWEKRQWEQPGALTARLGTPFWHLKGAYTTHENCMAERDRQFRLSANLEREVLGNEGFEEVLDETLLTFSTGGTEKYMLQYMCLPNTFDPRERE